MLTGVTGSKNVTSESRTFTENFTGVKVSHGIDVKLTQEDEVKFTAEMDDNLHELLITEVEDGVLKIYFKENVRTRKASTVYLSFPVIDKIKTSSGAEVKGQNKLKVEELAVDCSSGSEVNIHVDAKQLILESSSGSEIEVEGVSEILQADSSSGSKIEADKLKAKIVNAEASSGADIDVFASESITAKASSGASIDCDGDPKEKSIKKSSGGHVRVN
jgi:hypothetical protein